MKLCKLKFKLFCVPHRHLLPQALEIDTYLCDIFSLHIPGEYKTQSVDVKTCMHSSPSANTIFYLNGVQFHGKIVSLS